MKSSDDPTLKSIILGYAVMWIGITVAGLIYLSLDFLGKKFVAIIMTGIFGLVGFGANVNLLGWCERHLPDKLAGWVGYSDEPTRSSQEAV